MNAMPKKICTACAEEKPTQAFLVSKLRPGGRTDRCWACIKAAAAANRAGRESRSHLSDGQVAANHASLSDPEP